MDIFVSTDYGDVIRYGTLCYYRVGNAPGETVTNGAPDEVYSDCAACDSDELELIFIEMPFSTWHRYAKYEDEVYVNSTKYIDGNQTGSDPGSRFGPDIFDDYQSVGFEGYNITLGAPLSSTGNTITLSNTSFLKHAGVGNFAVYPAHWPGRHAGTDFVKNFDLSFTFSGEGKITVGPLACEASGGYIRIFTTIDPGIYLYEVTASLTNYQAVFQDGVLTIKVNGVTAITEAMESVAPVNESTWEIRTSGSQSVVISNFAFLAPDENLQQVKTKYSYSEGEIEQSIASIPHTYYGYTYYELVDANIYTQPAMTIAAPSITTGDMLRTDIYTAGYYLFETEEWAPIESYRNQPHITTFEARAQLAVYIKHVEGTASGSYYYGPPFTRTSPYQAYSGFSYFPIGYPKWPVSYTAVVYVKAAHSSNIAPSVGSFIPQTDASYDWGIPGVLADWVEVARQSVASNTKGSIDISDMFVFPTAVAATDYDSTIHTGNNYPYWDYALNDETVYPIYTIYNAFYVKLVMEVLD